MKDWPARDSVTAPSRPSIASSWRPRNQSSYALAFTGDPAAL